MAKTHISRRHVLTGTGVVGAAGLVGLVPALTANAATGDTAIVGAWRGTATLKGTPSFGTLLSFAAGGSLVHSASVDLQSAQLSTPSYGAWKSTGSGKYSIKFYFFTFDAQTNPAGSGVVTEKLTVDGDDLEGTLKVTIFDISGKVVFTSPGTIKARRIEVD